MNPETATTSCAIWREYRAGSGRRASLLSTFTGSAVARNSCATGMRTMFGRSWMKAWRTYYLRIHYVDMLTCLSQSRDAPCPRSVAGRVPSPSPSCRGTIDDSDQPLSKTHRAEDHEGIYAPRSVPLPCKCTRLDMGRRNTPRLNTSLE